jgi:cyclic pyranopterin phosphate synthase
MVTIKGINDTEVLDVLEYDKERGMSIRFIKYMKILMQKRNLKVLVLKKCKIELRQNITLKL